MTKASDNAYPSLLVTQGTVPASPAAGKQRLYIDSTSLTLKRVNSSGAITSLEATSGIPSGTSNPGSPTTNDLFFRTDLGWIIIWDGTRWVTTRREAYLGQFPGVTVTSFVDVPWSAIEADFDLYIEKFYASLYSTGLSGSAYWTLGWTKYDAGAGTTICTVNNISGANDVYLRKTATVNALLGTANDGMSLSLAKTSTPGACEGAALMTYRVVVP